MGRNHAHPCSWQLVSGVGLPPSKRKIAVGETYSFSPSFNVPALPPNAEVPGLLRISYLLNVSVGRAHNFVIASLKVGAWQFSQLYRCLLIALDPGAHSSPHFIIKINLLQVPLTIVTDIIDLEQAITAVQPEGKRFLGRNSPNSFILTRNSIRYRNYVVAIVT